MKKFLFLILSLFVALPLFAQDMIVRRDGTIVPSKVMEISSSEIKYKKFTNPDGPLYSLKVSEVLSINFQNGEVERFEQAAEPTPAPAAEPAKPTVPQLVEVVPDANNQALLDKYNNSQVEILTKKAPSDKVMDAGYSYKFGVTSGSVLSTKDIEVAFEHNYTQIRGANYFYHRDIKMTNKTDETIYIDLAKSFRVNLDGSSHIYYDGSKQTSVTSAGSTGMSVHLGAGISVGGGGANATTTTYSNERILTIPPHSHVYFSTYKRVGKEVVSAGEPRQIIYFMPWEVKRRAIYNFTESDTPGLFKYTITYSKDADFSTYSQLKFDLYIQQVLGLCRGEMTGKLEFEHDHQTCIVAYKIN